MGDHHPAVRGRVADDIGQDTGNVFVRQTVESVASNSLFGQPPRQGEGGGDLRLGVVEGSVKTRDLRQGRMQLRYRRNGCEVMRPMERSERNKPGQLSDDLSVDAHRFLVPHTTMNDAMPGRDQPALRKTLFEPAQQRGKRILVSCAFSQMLIAERRSGAILGGEMYAVADPRALAVAEKVLARRPLLAGKERELDAR